MKKQKLLNLASSAFILLSAFSFLSVSLMAFHDPQAVMDLVNVKLNNTDASSSIRGVYGGVGFTIVLLLLYLLRFNKVGALQFLFIIWGTYALSRLMTILIEGPLGNFGSQWLVIESVFCGLALILYWANFKYQPA